MGLKEVLTEQGVKLPPDFDERYAEIISVLRGGPVPVPQKAGAEPEAEAEVVTDPAAECNHNDFVCKAIKRAQHSQGIIGVISAVYGVATILSQLEKMPLGGPLLKVALNIVSATLKGASALTDGADKVLGKLPFFVGYLASFALYLIYVVLQLLLGLLSFSREKHAEAIKALISIVPFAGLPLANAFETANVLAGETDASIGKLMADLDRTFTLILKGVANLPPMVSARIQAGKTSLEGLQNKGTAMVEQAKNTGTAMAQQVQNTAQQVQATGTQMVEQAQTTAQQVQNTGTQMVEQAQNTAQHVQNTGTQLVEQAQTTAQQVQATGTQMVEQAKNTAQPPKQGGRKRFSRRTRRRNKWQKFHLQRTRRHRFGSRYESGLI